MTERSPAAARFRLNCVRAVMEHGAENDRRGPFERAEEIFKFCWGPEIQPATDKTAPGKPDAKK